MIQYCSSLEVLMVVFFLEALVVSALSGHYIFQFFNLVKIESTLCISIFGPIFN